MKKITFLLTLILLFAFQTINAQSEISPAKKQAIKDLIVLINKDNSAEQLFTIMSAQAESMNNEIIKSVLNERTDLTASEKESLEKTLIEDYRARTKQFQERLLQKLDFNKMTEEIMITVYDKYYTLEEINDLIAFYKTPTGQKLLKTMQPLMVDTLRMTTERLVPKITSVMEELREEQRLDVTKKIEELKPNRTKTNK